MLESTLIATVLFARARWRMIICLDSVFGLRTIGTLLVFICVADASPFKVWFKKFMLAGKSGSTIIPINVSKQGTSSVLSAMGRPSYS